MGTSAAGGRVVVAMTGATGALYGIRLVEALRAAHTEIHLVASEWALKTIAIETDYRPADVMAMATRTYRPDNQAAAISSGSFLTRGMIIAPCSMKTVAAIAGGYADNLIARAADVTLKEQRKLVLMVRESPLSVIHLENMLKLARIGAVIAPPVPAFYSRPDNIAELVDQTVGRLLDQFGIGHSLISRWGDPASRRMSAAE